MSSALNKIWNVPRRDRFGVTREYARALLFLVLALIGTVTAAGTAVITDSSSTSPRSSGAPRQPATATALFAVIGVAHRMLVSRPAAMGRFLGGRGDRRRRGDRPAQPDGAILPTLVRKAGPVYGSFATVVGIFTLLYLINQALVLSIEIATVIEARLSPRGLTDDDLTEADHRALELQARRQERVPGQRVTTTFQG